MLLNCKGESYFYIKKSLNERGKFSRIVKVARGKNGIVLLAEEGY